MSQPFRPGDFERQKLIKPMRAFCPIRAELKIEEVNLEGLQKRGKKLLMLDLDNTLTMWRSEEFDPSVVEWIERAKSLGLKLALISNSIKGERSYRVGARFDIPVFRGRWKPSRSNYRKALRHYNLQPEDAIMFGDQLLTDVLGANRAGVEAVWIQPRGKSEFKGTKANRWIEGRLIPSLYGVMTAEENIEAGIETALHAKPGTGHQIMRFVLVGGTVWVINTALAILFANLFGKSLGTWMMDNCPTWMQWAKTPLAEARPVLWWAAALIAMLFSFMLNRSWTFGVRGKAQRMKHLRRFYAVSILGTVFNTLLANWFITMLGGSGTFQTILAQGFSAVIVAFWNFFGQRLYAFKDE